MKRFRFSLFACLVVAAISVPAQVPDFSQPERVTDDSANYRLSRTANSLMGTGSDSTLHITYWSGDIASTPGTPSFIYYRSWTPSDGWTVEVNIDDSLFMELHVGGRHPSLAVRPDDSIWIVWHDSRHCTPAGNWIDNTEIYADSKPPGGAFNAADIRLTNTTAAHLGDNGITPKIRSLEDGRLVVSWHDFHLDRGISDIYIKESDTAASFDLGESMIQMQGTDLNDRGATPSFTVPDLAVDASGTVHLVWATGFGSDGDLNYGELPTSATRVTEQLLAAAATDFFDPPHIEIVSNGDVWVAYGDDSATGGEDVVLLRKPAGNSAFDPPVVIADDSARQFAPDHAIDDGGHVHLVWVDQRSGTHIYYGLYDPMSGQLDLEMQLTATSGPWERPSIHRDYDGKIYVLWEENTSLSEGNIWFTTTALSPTSNQNWNLYD